MSDFKAVADSLQKQNAKHYKAILRLEAENKKLREILRSYPAPGEDLQDWLDARDEVLEKQQPIEG